MPSKKTTLVPSFSDKGFFAIDLDGTAVVQKIDHNTAYGLKNSRSDLRKLLIEYMKAAQSAGFDIIILTARPELVDKWLLEPGDKKLGTKSTHTVIDELNKQHGIQIKQIVRAPFADHGLKGKCMGRLLDDYKKQGKTQAKGILFDDLLKQIKSVQDQKNPSHLLAYDVNSYKDLKKFIKEIGETHFKSSEFHPKAIVVSFKESFPLLYEKIGLIDKQIYPKEYRDLRKILNELAIRYSEVSKCEYKPDIDFVQKTLDEVKFLAQCLIDNKISKKDIQRISHKLFGVSDPRSIKPMTKCEATLKTLMVHLLRLPILEEIKANCERYKAHLTKVIHTENHADNASSDKAKNKLKIVEELLLTFQSKNPTVALQHFKEKFEKNTKTLQLARSDNSFVNTIRALLAKLPFLGSFFKSKGTQFSDEVGKQFQSPKLGFFKNSTTLNLSDTNSDSDSDTDDDTANKSLG